MISLATGLRGSFRCFFLGIPTAPASSSFENTSLNRFFAIRFLSTRRGAVRYFRSEVLGETRGTGFAMADLALCTGRAGSPPTIRFPILRSSLGSLLVMGLWEACGMIFSVDRCWISLPGLSVASRILSMYSRRSVRSAGAGSCWPGTKPMLNWLKFRSFCWL